VSKGTWCFTGMGWSMGGPRNEMKWSWCLAQAASPSETCVLEIASPIFCKKKKQAQRLGGLVGAYRQGSGGADPSSGSMRDFNEQTGS
jgi:hypothetical protein